VLKESANRKLRAKTFFAGGNKKTFFAGGTHDMAVDCAPSIN
jgi:hypothetical protein